MFPSLAITGDLALDPGADVVGFPPAMITGVKEISNTASLAAQADLTIAYNFAQGLPANRTLSSIGAQHSLLILYYIHALNH
jgi:hypothetical protein